MKPPEIVLDTNILVAGLRSRRGAAFKLLSLVDSGHFSLNISVPLVLEYEEILLRPESGIRLSRRVIEDVVDYYCKVARHHQIFFLWRPFLKDPKDDMVLELAVRAGCQFIITYNTRHFVGIDHFGIQALIPAEFLRKVGVIP